MAIKINYMKLDTGAIMQNKYSKKLVINDFSFLTESGSGSILEEGLI